ncbi:MAG: hypothetical protein ACLRL6_01565 [Clostridium sp.]
MTGYCVKKQEEYSKADRMGMDGSQKEGDHQCAPAVCRFFYKSTSYGRI